MKELTLQLPDELYKKMMNEEVDWNELAIKRFKQVIKTRKYNKELTSAVFNQDQEKIKKLTSNEATLNLDRVVSGITEN